MKKGIKSRIAMAVVMAIIALSLQAAPAIRKPRTIQQPNGTTITIVQHGDEWCHWVTDQEDHLLVMDAEGNYHVASLEEEVEWEATKARNIEHRAEINSKRHQRLKAGRSEQQAFAAPGENHAASFPSKGQIHGLIVLVEYSDIKFAEDSADVAQHYQAMINSEGYSEFNHKGSAHDYYIQNSMGQFDPQFDIYGPITLSHNRSYYGQNDAWGNDAHAHEMVVEACQQLDSLVDFNLYDNNQDGIIDFVFAFYAGNGEHADGGKNTVWPHAWSLSEASGQQYFFDDVKLDSYACSCEKLYGQYDGVGTFCHEFTHVLGLPDIYDVNYSYSTFTPGEFDVLDQGSYNGATSGSCPAAINTYERYELGWIEPELFISGKDTLTYLGESNRAYILPVQSRTNDPRDGEYYLFENRQQKDWDTYIPGHGMLIWHIDYQESKWLSNNVNTTGSHQGVDIVEADGAQSAFSQSGDPFPGTSGITSFTESTTPALLGWDSHSSSKMTQPLNGAALSGIHEANMPELSDVRVITLTYSDNDHYVDTTGVNGRVLFNDGFGSIRKGSDKSVSGSNTAFQGNDNFVEWENAFEAGGALRLGKSTQTGSITTRPLDNAEGDSLYVEVKVKGWTSVEGTLKICAKSPATRADEGEVLSLAYSSTMADEYEVVGGMIHNCAAGTQIQIGTSNKRCFVSGVRIMVPAAHSTEDIKQVTVDQMPAHQPARKVLRNGKLVIETPMGTYNMQGVKM